MKYGIVVFPGTWSEVDCHYAISNVMGHQAEYVWHKEQYNLAARFDCVILPGGFSFGDYLRPGAIARFSPIMSAVSDFASQGGLVIGICNGFQLLCEAGLLPGALMRNAHLSYSCHWAYLRVDCTDSPFTRAISPGQVLRIPISHGEGNYYAEPETLRLLEDNGQVAFRYCDSSGRITAAANPNGSLGNIAGITNAAGNVLGMMPHPERACEAVLGSADGALILGSIAHPSLVA